VTEAKEMERSKSKNGIQMQPKPTCELESKKAVKSCQHESRQKYNVATKR